MKNRAVYRTTLGLAVVLGLGILVLVNWLGSRHYRRFDWTRAGLYTLSDKTVKVLKDLKAPVSVTVFMTEGTQLFPETQELVKRYKAVTPQLAVETLDPTRNRARAEALVKEFGVSGPSVVFQSGDRKKHVPVEQLAELDFSRARMGGEPTVKAFKGEQEFTSAILTVTQSKTPKVLFTTGHGERKTDSRSRDGFWGVAETFRRDNCKVEDWASLGAGDVPAGTDLLVIAGPKSAFTEAERDAIKKFLDAGGRALVFADAEFAPGKGSAMLDLGLRPLLESYGVVLDDDIVVDPKNRVPLMGPETVFANSYRPHPITKLLEGSAVVFPLARSVRVAEKVPEGLTATPLVETSPDGWGETDLKTPEARKDEKDVKGPVSLGVAVETAGKPERKMRLVVFGDADFASNGGVANAANSYLMAAAANWALEREALIAIPPRSTDQVAVTMTRSDIGTMSAISILLLPFLAISAGIAVYLRRRR
jgi:hypothetical protein